MSEEGASTGGSTVARAASKILKDSGRFLLRGVKAALGEPVSEADAVLTTWRQGETALDRRPTDLSDLVTRSMARASEICGQRRIDLLLERGDDLPPVEVDPRRLSAAIDALITCGLTAFADTTTVRVRLARDGDLVQVGVQAERQTPEDALQAELARDGSALAVAHAIAAAHGGRVEVVADAGVTLRLVLVHAS